jgi:hypothetical protein
MKTTEHVYFSLLKGLGREHSNVMGDPLSPMMFNIVAEVLAVMMTKAAGKGMVKGVMSHIIPEGVTHIQYADDTVLMIEGDVGSIINMKFILHCFEWLSGLKINYHKSEAFVFGMDENEKEWPICLTVS